VKREALVMTVDAAEAYQEIFDRIIPEAIEFFKSKTKDYEGGPAFQLLGTRGQFADINRKFWKLFHIVWEGKPPEFESESEIKMDMIGHLLMSLYLENPEHWHELERQYAREAWDAAKGVNGG